MSILFYVLGWWAIGLLITIGVLYVSRNDNDLTVRDLTIGFGLSIIGPLIPLVVSIMMLSDSLSGRVLIKRRRKP
jgi:hypothetical protein